MHGHYENHHGKWAAGRHRRGRFGGHGFGGRHGMGGGMNPDDMRAGRMLAQGDLRLLALSFIAEAPRHGYELIKLVEEKTSDWYSPSPGIVYPTLTYLEEAGYVTASTEGSKKLYAITDEGRAYLQSNRDVVDAVLDRLGALGERVNRWRRAAERGERDDRRTLPPLVEATIAHLRETIGKRLENDAEAEARVRAADGLRSVGYDAAKESGVCTCSGRTPMPNKRAGMRRSSGTASNSLNISGGLGRSVFCSAGPMIRFCIVS
jgi:DNA-binding PadR family transcriptional regulator